MKVLFFAEQYCREIYFICFTARAYNKFKHGNKNPVWGEWNEFFAQVITSFAVKKRTSTLSYIRKVVKIFIGMGMQRHALPKQLPMFMRITFKAT